MRRLSNISGTGHAIETNGIVASVALVIEPEDFDIIPANQDLYCANYHDSGGSAILKLSASWLTNYIGNLLITDAGEAFGSQPRPFIVSWDTAATNFITRSITLPDSIGGRFEHVTFAPISIPALSQ